MSSASRRASTMWNDGARWDGILVALRGEGFSKIDCIRATAELLRLPLADAKGLVHDSRAWADRRQHDDEWHDALIVELQAAVRPGGAPTTPEHKE